MIPTTLCYIEKDDCYLMLHRTKKKNDVNEGKWIGVGGKFEEHESPEECLLREVEEETGLLLLSWKLRGIVTFVSEGWESELMFLYTADSWEPSRPNPGSRVGEVSDRQEAGPCAAAGIRPVDGALPFASPLADACLEGDLWWIPRKELMNLRLWEGDKIFLKLLQEEQPFFSLKLSYKGDELVYAALDGRMLNP